MHHHVIALVRWLCWHRHEITLTTGLILVVGVLMLATPLTFAIAPFEWKYSRRQRLVAVGVLVLLTHAARWLWRELHGTPHGPWHACTQCGVSIDDRSRAAYCSHTCRSYARLERDARANDPGIADRAERRLRARRLRRLADADPTLVEIPF